MSKGSGAAPSRDKLVAILDTYPAGIQARSAKNVQTLKGCMRIENDMLNVPCAVAYEALKFPVTNRGFFPDTKTGFSLTKFYFNQEKKGGMMAKMGRPRRFAWLLSLSCRGVRHISKTSLL